MTTPFPDLSLFSSIDCRLYRTEFCILETALLFLLFRIKALQEGNSCVGCTLGLLGVQILVMFSLVSKQVENWCSHQNGMTPLTQTQPFC